MPQANTTTWPCNLRPTRVVISKSPSVKSQSNKLRDSSCRDLGLVQIDLYPPATRLHNIVTRFGTLHVRVERPVMLDNSTAPLYLCRSCPKQSSSWHLLPERYSLILPTPSVPGRSIGESTPNALPCVHRLSCEREQARCVDFCVQEVPRQLMPLPPSSACALRDRVERTSS